MAGWIAVDMDGTLAEWTGTIHKIGPPIPRMVERVRVWLAAGRDVRIFTARVCDREVEELYKEQIRLINEFCIAQFGRTLVSTCRKDWALDEIWDDKAYGVVPGTGLSFYEQLN